jgi:hypothetical protein
MPEATLKTRTAQVALLPSGVTAVRIDPEAVQTVDDARENIAMAVKVGAPWMRPLLVDIRNSRPLEAPVRHYYSGQILVDSFLAICMLIDISPLSRMMGNLYLQVAKPGIPTRLETTEPAALAWLEERLAAKGRV